MVLKDESTQQIAKDVPDGRRSGNTGIQEIIAESNLPKLAKAVSPAVVRTRTMTRVEIEAICADSYSANPNHDFAELSAKRRAALSENIGVSLTCVLIRLPGTTITVEIDLAENRVVYLESNRS